MDAFRARQIAESFKDSEGFAIQELAGGLLVHHHGRSSYFVREANFWSFIFRAAGAARLKDITEIEAQLSAS